MIIRSIKSVLSMRPKRHVLRGGSGICILVCLAILAVIAWWLVWTLESLVESALFNLSSQLSNTIATFGSCRLRKEPTLLVLDGKHLIVTWESSCHLQSTAVHWSYRYENGSRFYHVIDGELYTQFDSSHFTYRAQVPLVLDNSRNPIAYSYYVHWNQHKTPVHRPRCLAPYKRSCTPLRLGFMSDNQYGAVAFYRIAKQVSETRPDYVFHLGDAVQQADNLQQWQTDFFDVLSSAGLSQVSPLVYIPGNHDDLPQTQLDHSASDRDTKPQHYLYTDQRAYGAISIGPLRLIKLNSNLDTVEQDQFVKLELESPEFKAASFRIVLVHIPPFMEFWDPVTWERGEKNWGRFVRDRYVQLFEQHGVDLVMSGHQHNYERGHKNDVTYLIIGGAGGQLEQDRVETWGYFEVVHNLYHYGVMDVYHDTLVWRVFDIEGRPLDELTLKSKHKD